MEGAGRSLCYTCVSDMACRGSQLARFQSLAKKASCGCGRLRGSVLPPRPAYLAGLRKQPHHGPVLLSLTVYGNRERCPNRRRVLVYQRFTGPGSLGKLGACSKRRDLTHGLELASHSRNRHPVWEWFGGVAPHQRPQLYTPGSSCIGPQLRQ